MIKPLICQGKIPVFEADRGYDSQQLRLKILALKIYPMISYRKMGKNNKNGIVYIEKKRWVVERAISWLQRKFRRITIRWERKWKYWTGFLSMSLIMFWIDKILRLLG